MPTISIFYGILIKMFFQDTGKHHAPHAVYAIDDGTVLSSSLPPAKHKRVVAWIEIHREDLLADWSLAVTGRMPLPIRGLE